jgi:hypothetical protein
VVRRDLLDWASPFDTSLHNTKDWKMWLPPDVSHILDSVRRIEQVHHTRADRGRRGRARRGRDIATDLWEVMARRLLFATRRRHVRWDRHAWTEEAREWLDVLTESDAGPVAL